jgi:hypothetical protein
MDQILQVCRVMAGELTFGAGLFTLGKLNVEEDQTIQVSIDSRAKSIF